MTARVPDRAVRLAKWSLAPWERQAVLGDLQEEFHDIGETRGESAARRWYWRQVLLSTWPNLIRRARGDDARRSQTRAGVAQLSFGIVFFVQTLGIQALPRTPRQSAYYFVLSAGSLTFGALAIVLALVSKRIRVPSARAERSLWVFLLALAALLFLVIAQPPQATRFEPYLAFAMISIIAVANIVALSGAYPAPVEFLVRTKTRPGDPPGAWLELDVPNVPLALSSVILCRANGESPRGVYRDSPTIDRVFSHADTIRLYAVVNAPGAHAHATLDVIDAAGATRASLSPPVIDHALEEVVKSWDDVADRDPEDHFGQIDVTLPLAGLACGKYRLRVTVDDGERMSVQQERIEIKE